MPENKTKRVWTSEDGLEFHPAKPVYSKIPNGIYHLKYSIEQGPHLSKVSFNNDKPLKILNSYYEDISDDFNRFINLKNKYKSSGVEFNRAILIHGQPGCGKKYLCRRVAESYDGIVIYVEDPTDLNSFISFIKESNENTDILIIMEDFGVSLEKYGISAAKNILKSNENKDGVYFIATTNFESKIAEFLTDKPGMFEEKFFIEYPDDVERGQYIRSFCENLDIKITKSKIGKMSKDTHGLAIGHIKNLIESVELYGYNYSEKLEELKEMKDNIISSTYSDNPANNIGFE
jgi:SpoVK/Ycf46/Vps4 family AAA+-type ATPase